MRALGSERRATSSAAAHRHVALRRIALERGELLAHERPEPLLVERARDVAQICGKAIDFGLF